MNPDVDAETHPYISTGLKENKFGVSVEKAFELCRRAARETCQTSGIDCYIGSQLNKLDPFMDALERVLGMVSALAEEGITPAITDLGGLVTFITKKTPHPSDYLSRVTARLQRHGAFDSGAGAIDCGQCWASRSRGSNFKDTGHKHFRGH